MVCSREFVTVGVQTLTALLASWGSGKLENDPPKLIVADATITGYGCVISKQKVET